MRSAGGQNLEQITWANITMFRAVLRRLTEPAILRALATPCTGKQSILCLVKRNNCALESFQNMSCHCITVMLGLQDKIQGAKVWGACSTSKTTLLCWRHTSPHTAVLVRLQSASHASTAIRHVHYCSFPHNQSAAESMSGYMQVWTGQADKG